MKVSVGRAAHAAVAEWPRMDRIARIVLGIASPLALVACFVEGETGRVTFVVVTPLIPAALIALGGARSGEGRRLAWVVLGLTVMLEAGSVGVMLLSRPDTSSTLVAGLPASTLVMLLALGVGPLLLIPVSHALLFGASREP